LTLDAGFDRQNVVLVATRPPQSVTSAPERASAYDEIGLRLRGIPGVASVARSFVTPIADDNWMTPIIADTTNPPTGQDAIVYFNFVTAGYFSTLRTPMLSGRDFTQDDERSGTRLAIVNESVVQKFFPGQNALGKHFRVGSREPSAPVEIVGIVKDSKYMSLKEETPPTVFVPATQAPAGAEAGQLVIRTSVSPSGLMSAIQQTVLEWNKNGPLRIRTLDEQVGETLAQERVLATLAGFFGALALLLTMIGLYGVLNYVVTQRRTEFGIRMALGAATGSILRLVLKDVALIAACALTVGLAVALASVHLLQGMLFGLEARDMSTMITAVVMLSATALLAAFFPARRATRVDPTISLRAE
jgi:predicted permease